MAKDTTNTPPDPEWEKFAFELNPEYVRPSRNSWMWTSVITLLVVVAIAVAVTVGIMRSRAQPSTRSADDPAPAAGVFVSGTVNETVLILVGVPGAYSDITVASTTTDTVQIKGLPQNGLRVLSAALSPQADRVAYIHEKNVHRFVSVSDLKTGKVETLDSNALKQAAWGASVEPCSWSPIAWSPDGKRFHLFLCEKDASTLAVVDTTTSSDLTPIFLQKTRSDSALPRQAFWLDSSNIVYTHVDSRSNEGLVSRTAVDEDEEPYRVYTR